jgi:hypothetical protein
MKTETIGEKAILADDKKTDLERMALIVLVGTALSLAFHYALAFYLNRPYPYSTFLFDPHDWMNDFNNMYEIVTGFSPYHSAHWFQSNYFPFANVFFSVFAIIPSRETSLVCFLLVFAMIYVAFVMRMNRRFFGLPAYMVFILFIASYPMLFAVDRANVEIYLFLCLAFFCYMYFKAGNEIAGAVFLGATIAMKLYPGVFLVLFIRDRKWKALGLTLAVTATLTFVPLLLFRGGIVSNVSWMMDAFREFSQRSTGIGGLQHSSTLYGCIKIFFGMLYKLGFLGVGSDFFVAFDASATIPYAVAVALLFAVICVPIVLKKVGNHAAILLLTGSMQLLPFVSYDYKLIAFYVPLAFFIARTKTRRFDGSMAALYGLLLIPKDYVFVFSDVSIAVLINSLIVAGMMALALLGEKAPRPVVAEIAS